MAERGEAMAKRAAERRTSIYCVLLQNSILLWANDVWTELKSDNGEDGSCSAVLEDVRSRKSKYEVGLK